MGVALKVDLGEIAAVHSSRPFHSEIGRDAALGGGPQLVVSFAGADEAGFMRSLLAALAPSGVAKDVFSVDASLGTTVLGMYTSTLVVRPVEGGLSEAEAKDRLKAAVDGALRDRPGHKLLWLDVPSTPPKASRDIFDERHLSEYRFELPRGRWMSDPGMLQVAHEFAVAVSELGAPIPYLYFPQQADLLDGRATMRIGVGRTAELKDIVLLDGAASEVARKYNARARRSLGMSADTRFKDSLVDLSPERDADLTAGPDEAAVVLQERAVDAVSMAAWAEVGLMARALGRLVHAHVPLVGASMSVIGSKSVCTFVTRNGQGAAAKEALRRVAPWDFLEPSNSPVVTRTAETRSYWLDWCVPDEAGVLLMILESLEEARRQTSPDATLNLDYCLSRVLRGRREFAGKACVSGDEMDVTVLRSFFEESTASRHPEWSDRIRLGSDEISAHPWTSLQLFDKFGGIADAPLVGEFSPFQEDDAVLDIREDAAPDLFDD